MDTQLEPFGLKLPFLGFGKEIEVVLDKDSAFAMVFSRPSTLYFHDRGLLEVKGFAEDPRKIQEAFDILGRFRKSKLRLSPGTLRESRMVEMLKSDLRTLSPNGKKLSDPSFQQCLQKLFDEDKRLILSRAFETYEGEPIPEVYLSELKPTKKQKEAVDEVIQDLDLFQTRYVIACRSCGEQVLSFQDREKAKDAVKHSSKKCALCEGTSLIVREMFQPTSRATQAIQQGLWLEKLVEKLSEERSLVTVSGRMLETNELDVVSVAYDSLVLFECKDTSFGQNNFYVMAMKAQELDADIMVIVTTTKVSENVKKVLGRHAGKERERPIHLVEASDEDGIRKGVNTIFDSLETSYKSMVSLSDFRRATRRRRSRYD